MLTALTLAAIIVSAPPCGPVHLGAIETLDLPMAVDVEDDVLCIADRFGGLHVVDVTDPGAPVVLATQPLAGTAWDVAIEDGIAYVASGLAGLQVVDVRSPASPVRLGALTIEKGGSSIAALGVDVRNGLVTIVDDTKGVHLVDVSDPSEPLLIDILASTARGAVIADDHLLVVDAGAGLVVADHAGEVETTLDLAGSLRAIATGPDIGVVAADRAGIVVLSLAGGVQAIGGLESRRAVDVALRGRIACVADAREGLLLVDLAYPAHPVMIGASDIPSAPRGVAIEGNSVFVADMATGVHVFDVGACTCAADVNADGELDLTDFVAFQDLWQARISFADCDGDGAHTIQDFVCYQQRYIDGCP